MSGYKCLFTIALMISVSLPVEVQPQPTATAPRATVENVGSGYRASEHVSNDVSALARSLSNSSSTLECANCDAYIWYNDPCVGPPPENTVIPECYYQEFDVGYECVPPDPEGWTCYLCDSFPQYVDSCDDIPQHSEADYLGQSLHEDAYAFCQGLSICGDWFGGPDLEALVSAADVTGLRSALFESEGKLFLNRDRHALQGVDCYGRVIRHIPLSTDVYEALVEPSTETKAGNWLSELWLGAGLLLLPVVVRTRGASRT